MKHFTLLTLSLFALTLAACEKKNKEDADAPTPAAVQEEEQVPVATGGNEEKKLIDFYSNTVCMMADPAFWDDFWDDDDEKTQAEEDPEYYYKQSGYSGEDEVVKLLEKYAPRKSFETGLVKAITDKCGENIPAEIMDSITGQLRRMAR